MTVALTNRAWFDLALLALIWGAIFLVVELTLQSVTPFWTVAHRVFWAALLLWLIAALGGRRPPRDLRLWIGFLGMGILANALPFSLITWGQTEIESGLASILNASTAFFGIVVASAFLADERLTPRRVAGVVLGVAGVATVIGLKALAAFDPRALGQIAVLCAALSYAFSGVWARVMLAGAGPLVSSAGMLTCSSMVMIPLAWIVEGPPALALGPGALAAIGYMSLIGTAGAYLLYYRILAVAGSGNLLLVTVMMPPISILLGWAVLGERLEAADLGGCALILAGLAILDGRLWRRLAGRGREA